MKYKLFLFIYLLLSFPVPSFCWEYKGGVEQEADLIPVVYSHTSATPTLTDINCYGNINYNGSDSAKDFTLPVAAAGLVCCFDANGYSRIITVDTADGTDSIKLGGTSLTAGNAIDTSGGSGEQFCLAGRDASTWIAYPGSAYLADGGAD